jgi:hypothetical protein
MPGKRKQGAAHVGFTKKAVLSLARWQRQRRLMIGEKCADLMLAAR